MMSTFTTPYSPAFRHLTLKTTNASALFVFESQPDLDPKTPPRIHRFYQSDHCYSPMDNGKVIGHGLSPKCALLINAGTGDLVAITERLLGSCKLLWRYYRIGKNLEILPLDPDNRKLSREEINRLLKTNPENSGSLLVDKDDIAKMFLRSQPSWLQVILDAQLLYWHQYEPPNYYKHTRRLPTPAELQRCVTCAPYQALERWKLKLSRNQLDQAIRASSEAAVRFAIEHIPLSLREDYLERNPSWALQNAKNLSDAELAMCSKGDSKTALRLLPKFRLRQRAIALAHCYFVFWCERNDDHLVDFRAVVLESMRSYPVEWFAAHDGHFERLVEDLHLYLSLRLDAAALAGLLACADPAVKTGVAGYIASRV